MNVDPTAILVLLSEQVTRIADLQAENEALRQALTVRQQDSGPDRSQV